MYRYVPTAANYNILAERDWETDKKSHKVEYNSCYKRAGVMIFCVSTYLYICRAELEVAWLQAGRA